MENIIRDTLLQHFLANGLITSAQHGFLPKKSCITNLLETMDILTQAIEDGYPIDIIFLDFAKAFDTVAHSRLILKLSSYGIVDRLLNWIKAFLGDRFQRVVLGDNISEWIRVLSGVPQGSVLGPLLFVIFINDLVKNLPDSCKCKLFADDTKLISIIKCNQDCDKLQLALDKLVQWSNTWLLKFNNDKCKVMHCGVNNNEYDYVMESKSLSKTELERDLGVYVSKDLNWQYHINYMVNKANRVLGSIKHTFSYLDANSIKLLFTSLVRPHLEYAAPIWNPNSSGIGKSQQIENIQRRATRTQDLKRFSYQDRLYLLNLPSLENRRSRGDLIQFFKIMNGINDVEWHNPPRLMSLNRESRFHNKRIERELTKVRSIRYDFLPNRIARKWNSLSQEVVNLTETNKFKNAIDKFQLK
jgi:hypothetical protein